MVNVPPVGPTPPTDGDGGGNSSAVDRNALGGPSSSMPNHGLPQPRRRQKPIRPHSEADLDNAMELMGAAEAADVKVRPKAVERHLGLISPSPMRRALEVIMGPVPLIKTERQRIAAAQAHLRQRQDGKQADELRCQKMSEWFEGLSDTQRQAVDVMPAAAGGPAWMQSLTLHVRETPGSGGETPPPFKAEHLVDWPPHIVASLPRDAQAMLAERAGMLGSLDIQSGAEAVTFIDEHFERTMVRSISGTPTSKIKELNKLSKLEPEAVRDFHDVDGETSFVRCKKMPDAVLDALEKVGVTQEGYTTTWLPQLIDAGIGPMVHRADLDAIREKNTEKKDKAIRKSENAPFRRALAERRYDSALEDQLGIEQAVVLIRNFSKDAMFFTAPPVQRPENALALERANSKLHYHFGRTYAQKRMAFDKALGTSEGAKAILTGLVIMTPITELLQEKLHLNAIGKAVAAVGDDVAGLLSQLWAFIKNKAAVGELLKNLGPLAVVGAISLVMAAYTDDIMSDFGANLAGAWYSLSAVMLSMATSLMLAKYFGRLYKRLERDGKLPKDFGGLDRAGAAKLAEIANQREPFTKGDLLKIVDDSLQRAGATQAERAAAQARLMRLDARKLLRNLRKEHGLSTRQKPFAAGFRETTLVNPANVGLAVGAAASPELGGIFGPEFLHKWALEPALYSFAGSFETVVGAIAIWIFGSSFYARWDREIEGKDKEGQDRVAEEIQVHPPAEIQHRTPHALERGTPRAIEGGERSAIEDGGQRAIES